jgi:hypothetical protein
MRRMLELPGELILLVLGGGGLFGLIPMPMVAAAKVSNRGNNPGAKPQGASR